MLLPCNKYARVGNYFLGNYWRTADKWRKKLGVNIVLGAIDCIPIFCNGEIDAVVLENEMHRVAGCDIYPRYDPEKIRVISEGIYNGLLRIHEQFDKIIVLLNVRLYIEAMKEALTRLPLGIKSKIDFDYIYGYPGKFQRKLILKLKEIRRLGETNK